MVVAAFSVVFVLTLALVLVLFRKRKLKQQQQHEEDKEWKVKLHKEDSSGKLELTNIIEEDSEVRVEVKEDCSSNGFAWYGR